MEYQGTTFVAANANSYMLETLLHWDAVLYQWINSGLGNPVFDALLPWCRERWFWAPLYLFVIAFTFVNVQKRPWLIIIGLLLTVGLTDFTSSTLIKNKVHRLRPCNDPEMVDKVQLRVPCGSGYSFTSSHAANHFSVAVFLIGVFGGRVRWLRPVALSWAGLISFSQVYVGVHYPGDILCGALIGCAMGWWGVSSWRKISAWLG